MYIHSERDGGMGRRPKAHQRPTHIGGGGGERSRGKGGGGTSTCRSKAMCVIVEEREEGKEEGQVPE